MKDISKLVGEIVLSVGGIGVIIVSISGFIAKVWSDILIKRKSAKYEEELKIKESALETERNRSREIFEQKTHKNITFFETEYANYKALIEIVCDLMEGLDAYRSNKSNENRNIALDIWKDAIKDEKRIKCFIEVDIDKKLLEYFHQFQKVLFIANSDNIEVVGGESLKLSTIHNEILEDIRVYFNKIKTV